MRDVSDYDDFDLDDDDYNELVSKREPAKNVSKDLGCLQLISRGAIILAGIFVVYWVMIAFLVLLPTVVVILALLLAFKVFGTKNDDFEDGKYRDITLGLGLLASLLSYFKVRNELSSEMDKELLGNYQSFDSAIGSINQVILVIYGIFLVYWFVLGRREK